MCGCLISFFVNKIGFGWRDFDFFSAALRLFSCWFGFVVAFLCFFYCGFVFACFSFSLLLSASRKRCCFASLVCGCSCATAWLEEAQHSTEQQRQHSMVGIALSAPPKRPAWLKALLSDQFFGPCSIHAEIKKNEVNIFCVDCCASICQHCLSCHRNHRLLQVRRYVYHDVIRLHDMQKLLDCSLVQTYITNSARVVFLNQRPQSRLSKGLGNSCETCDRVLQEPYRYCSVRCKVDAVNNLSSVLMACTSLQLTDFSSPSPGSGCPSLSPTDDDAAAAAVALPATTISMTKATTEAGAEAEAEADMEYFEKLLSSTSAATASERTGCYWSTPAAAAAAAATQTLKQKLSQNQSTSGAAAAAAAIFRLPKRMRTGGSRCSNGVVLCSPKSVFSSSRRKGCPHRSPLY